jgi:hypothetical protein
MDKFIVLSIRIQMNISLLKYLRNKNVRNFFWYLVVALDYEKDAIIN